MGSIWIFIVLLAIFIVATWVINKSKPGRKQPASYPYRARGKLFTNGELHLLAALREVTQHDVYGKVRLEDIVHVRSGLSQSERASARGYIKSRHIDFVLCDKGSSQILAAIELDDSSHRRPGAQHGDEIKSKALKAAGVPLLRVTAASSYDRARLAEQLEELLG